MTVTAGLVCGNCDHLNSKENRACMACGSSLALKAANEGNATTEELSKLTDAPSDAGQPAKEDESMEQARHKVCSDCYTPVPAGHKFCGKCGKSLADNVAVNPEYFGDLQTPGKAKLILIKGEGVDGMSYHLNSVEHIAGRSQGEIVFSDDPWLSPIHANFIYQDGQLVVRDENSLNGVYVAVREPMLIAPGTVFMAGEQVFRVEDVAPLEEAAEDDGTYFFSSPFKVGGFRIVQILEGGGDGMVVNPKESKVVIGREDCDMNFPADPFISGNHVKVEKGAEGLVLTDLGSKNGTFVKINKERVLVHGDYLFLGRQLLRVEIAN